MGTVWITGGLFVLILVLLEESGFTQAHGTGAYGAGAGYGAAPYGGSGFGNAAATCTPEIRTAISLFLSTQGANMNQGMNNISPAIAPLFSLCFPMFPLLLNNNNNNGLAAMAPFLMTGGFGMGGFGFPGGASPLALAGAGGYGGGGY